MLIYVSCSNTDKAYAGKLKVVCTLMKRQGVTLWDTWDIVPGTRWQTEMAERLKEAFLFVPLMSPDFFASDRCEAELTAALRLSQQSKIQIAPVLIRPSSWEDSDLHLFPIIPSNKKAVVNWGNQDNAWLNVQSALMNIVRSRMIEQRRI